MAEVKSPFPPGTTERVIYVDAAGNVLPTSESAVRGEVTVTFPDGSETHTTFSLNGQPPQY